ncbi:MAG TPA: hypothetical protein VFP61_15595 [Acidimicrobiales bacterium]|nr:hypothetical protein [Acidimicrobiales bacterium]
MASASRLFTRGGLLATGVAHFALPHVYEPLVPDELPAARALVYASGVAEVATALAAWHPRTRRVGRWLGLATMAGVFPTHLHMLARSQRWPRVPRWAMWGRLPLQAVFCWWIWADTRA